MLHLYKKCSAARKWQCAAVFDWVWNRSPGLPFALPWHGCPSCMWKTPFSVKWVTALQAVSVVWRQGGERSKAMRFFGAVTCHKPVSARLRRIQVGVPVFCGPSCSLNVFKCA